LDVTLPLDSGPWIALPDTRCAGAEYARNLTLSRHLASLRRRRLQLRHLDRPAQSHAVVCTVFAGGPNGHVTTDWDRQCGFADARRAMRERIAEGYWRLDAMSSLPPTLPAARVTVVVLTHNRIEQVLDTLGKLLALPDQPPIVLVDNASTDGTSARVSQRYPCVRVVTSKTNRGAAGRNLGVAWVATEYVAFCDDDMWWQANSLTRATAIMDASPNVAVLSARVVVGKEEAPDATCVLMKASPLGAHGLPGPALVGYIAGASVFRTEVFRRLGGYEPKLFIGGEEELLALDVLASALAIVYADDLVVHHHPSPLRDSALRRRLLARNAAWIAWLRLPFHEAWRATLRALAIMYREGTLLRDAFAMVAALRWALARRRVIPVEVRRMRAVVHQEQPRES
jgi:GT2 family glycosyltransferase